MRAATVILVLLVGRLAHAQPEPTGPVPADEKSFWTAYFLTAGTMAAAGAIGALGEETTNRRLRNTAGVIGVTGIVLGPSMGHFYLGRSFTTGLGLRLGSMGVVAALAVADPQLEHAGTVAGLVGAVGMFATGALLDLVTLPGAVRRYNREHRLHLAPLVTPSGNATGLALGGTF